MRNPARALGVACPCPGAANAVPVANLERIMIMSTTKTAAAANAPVSTGDDTPLAALFEHALKDIYYAEKKIYKALPKMIKAASDPALKEALTMHREETAGQIEVLEQVFESIGKRAKAEKCDAIDGILEEGSGLLEDFGKTGAGDAAIVFSCQAVEHYETTRYGSMVAFANALGNTEAAEMISGILAQEHAADEKLTGMAESHINQAAA
jgi:ferritin-like metal-binding protein YciE